MPSYKKAEIFSREDQNCLLCISDDVSVQENEDGTHLVMLKKIDSQNLLVGRIVKMTLYSTQGLQNLEAVTTFIADDFQANFIVNEWTKIIDRRNNVKIPVRLSGKLNGKIGADGNFKVIAPALPITILNLSVGGMLFLCNDSLEINTKYVCNVNLPHTPIDVTISVVRKDSPRESDFYPYGCAFQELSPNIDSSICHFIYQSQIEERKKDQLFHPERLKRNTDYPKTTS